MFVGTLPAQWIVPLPKAIAGGAECKGWNLRGIEAETALLARENTCCDSMLLR